MNVWYENVTIMTVFMKNNKSFSSYLQKEWEKTLTKCFKHLLHNKWQMCARRESSGKGVCNYVDFHSLQTMKQSLAQYTNLLTTPLLSTISWMILPFFPITLPTRILGTWIDSSLYSSILRAFLTDSAV